MAAPKAGESGPQEQTANDYPFYLGVSRRGRVRPVKSSAGADRQKPQECAGQATKPFEGCLPAGHSLALLEGSDLIAKMDRSGDERFTANGEDWFGAINCHAGVL
jgi:hypothetical protein